YAGRGTEEDGEKARRYLDVVNEHFRDRATPRALTILNAEVDAIVGRTGEARRRVRGALAVEAHPDLYLAAANLEQDETLRVAWVNRALEVDGLSPVRLRQGDAGALDRVEGNLFDRSVEGPLVSIIMPVHN